MILEDSIEKIYLAGEFDFERGLLLYKGLTQKAIDKFRSQIKSNTEDNIYFLFNGNTEQNREQIEKFRPVLALKAL